MTGFYRSARRRSCATACRSTAIAARRGHAAVRLQRRDASAQRYRAIDEAFGGYPHAIHYALKANSTLAIVRLLRELGSARRRQLGLGDRGRAARPASRRRDIVFTGVGKTPAELERAVALGVKAINVESAGELERIEAIARAPRHAARASRCASIPTSTRKSHPHISTGLKINKFGVPIDDARELLRDAAQPAGAEAGRRARPRRLADHDARAAAARRRGARRALGARAAATTASRSSTSISAAGSASPTTAREVPDRRPTTSPRCSPSVRATGLPIVLEPGRAIVGPAGVLLARVIDIKPRTGGAATSPSSTPA